jgi:hypothetical protein
VSYSGSWYSNANGVHSGGSANGAIDLYSMATLSFTGNSMSFILYTDEWSGYAAIYVDGVLKSEIDTFASPAKARANVYTISGLADGAHTASIRPSGQKNVASGGYWIWLDAFDVTTKASTSGGESTTAGSTSGTTTPTVTRVQENESSVTYKGSWHVNKNAVYSGGSAIGSMDARGGSTLAFNGTGASFILYTDEWSGIATISVDGVAQTEVDTYASPAQAQVNAYTISGLSPGPHTVSISPTGRRNPSSRGLWIWVDAFDVTN